MKGIALDQAARLHAESYWLEAVPQPKMEFGLTSIVIVVRGSDDISSCVDSIRRRTVEPYEIILTGHAPSDAVVDLLRSHGEVMIIPASEDGSFVEAGNLGIKASRGQQVVLLDGRVRVTTGWLRRLLQALHRGTDIAVAFPCSNHGVSGQQVEVPDAVGRNPTRLDGFAWERAKAHQGMTVELLQGGGFCVLLRREAVREIGEVTCTPGGMDGYGVQLVEDRFKMILSLDSFVFHDGLASRPGIVVPTAHANPPSVSFALERCDGGLRLVTKPILLSLCMIVRDNARTLPACLEGIRPWVNEMVVVNTGSVDKTPDIVRRFGGRLFHFPWCGDFSAARNQSLLHARGRWAFWMDSDDTIDPENGRKLKQLAAGTSQTQSNILGYVMQVHCPGATGISSDVTIVDHVKMFQNLLTLRFEGRIHEQILSAIRRANGEVAWTDIHVVHSGADYSPEGRRRKYERDIRLLHLDLRDRPNHTFVLFNLGMTQADFGRHEEAVEYLKRSLRYSDPSESHVRKIYALLASSLSQLGRHREALDACARGTGLFPNDPELNFRAGLASHRLGGLANAVTFYNQALASGEGRHFASLDRGISGFKCAFQPSRGLSRNEPAR